MPTHKKPESERFKGLAKYAEYLLARAVVSLLQRLPIGFAFRLGRGIGWLAWQTMKRRRATVRKNLEIVSAWLADGEESGWRKTDGECEPHEPLVSPCVSRVNMSGHEGAVTTHRQKVVQEPSESKSPPSARRHSLPLESQIREVFQRGGANLFAGFTFNRMTPAQVERHIRAEGLDQLKAALAEGRGAIILLAHMGPWEALTQLPGLARKHGIEVPFGAMYRPLNNAYLDDWFKTQREGQGTRLFSRRDGFHKPVDFLRSGGMLGILADQKMREGPKVPYFGAVTPTSPVPGLFQRRSGAPVLAVSIETLGASRWQIDIRKVEWPTEIAAKDRETPARVCNQAVQAAVARSPLDAFWLHKRF